MGVADTKVMPAGNTEFIATPVASSVPLFSTLTVTVTMSPMLGLILSTAVCAARSICGTDVSVTGGSLTVVVTMTSPSAMVASVTGGGPATGGLVGAARGRARGASGGPGAFGGALPG